MRIFFLCIILITAQHTWAIAQELYSKKLDVDFKTFLELVDKKHPERNITNLTLHRSIASQSKVGNLSDPEISFGRERIGLNPMPHEPSEAMWDITIKQMFPWPGALAAEMTAAEASSKRTELDTQALAFERQIEAKSIYISLVTANKLLEVEKENLSLSDKILKNATSRLKYGIGSHHEVIQSQNEKIILSSNLNSEEADFANLKDYAAQLMGFDDAANIHFIFALPAELTQPQDSLNDVTKNKLEAVQRETSARLEAERKKSLPNFMVSGSLMKGDAGMNQYSLMAGISIPLFSEGVRRGVDEETRIASLQTAEELAWHDKKKKLALTQLNRRRAAIEANLRSLEKEIIPNLKQHLESLSSEYIQGKVDFNAINQARKSLLKYQKTQIISEKNLALAAISLEKIQAGMLDGELEKTIPQIPSLDMASGMNESDAGNMDPSSMPEKASGRSMKKSKEMPVDEDQGKKSSMGGM